MYSIFNSDRKNNIIKLFDNMMDYNSHEESSIVCREIIDDKTSYMTMYNIDDAKQELIKDFKISEQTADTLKLLYTSYKYSCFGDGEQIEQEYNSDGEEVIDITYTLQEHRKQLWNKIPHSEYILLDKCFHRYIWGEIDECYKDLIQ
jgi:hypothetical protein